MKLYLQCAMGASGNMFMAALYELLPDKTAFVEKMQHLGFPDVVIEYNESIKCGITGTHISIKIDGDEEISDDVHEHEHDHHSHEHHEHEHNHHHGNSRRYGYKEIIDFISSLDLSEKVKDDALSVYKIIGNAEANVHGTTLDEIHFHEVGSIDAIVDVVGCSLLVDMLGITEITASPVHVGFGMIRCEHGILPVPAPATAEILKGIPMYNGRIEGELCTPTGAALLKHFASTFGSMPQAAVSKIGYGMGTKDFEAANCLRAFLYEDENMRQGDRSPVLEISCNLDDMTPEAIGAAFEILLDNGALDVYTTPIMMKKNRPAVMLSCLCTEENHNKLAELMLKHTITLGVRTQQFTRITLDRSVQTVKTKYGDIRVKRAEGFGTIKIKPEYDDVLAAAKKHNFPFNTVFEEVKRGC